MIGCKVLLKSVCAGGAAVAQPPPAAGSLPVYPEALQCWTWTSDDGQQQVAPKSQALNPCLLPCIDRTVSGNLHPVAANMLLEGDWSSRVCRLLLQGPFSARELRGWVAGGQLPADMPLWHHRQPDAQYMLGTLLGAADAAAARWRRIALPHVPRISALSRCRLWL